MALERRPDITEVFNTITDARIGDKPALYGFMAGVKPASYLPENINQPQSSQLLDLARGSMPDAMIWCTLPKLGSFPKMIIYSPSSITKRIEKEPSVAKWLGIDNRSVMDIMSLVQQNVLVEGFVLGYPYSALRSFEKFKEITAKYPNLTSFIIGRPNNNCSYAGWSSEDLETIRTIFSRYPRNICAEEFCCRPEIRPMIERLYKKYYDISDDDLNFLFSMRVVHTDCMMYYDSPMMGATVDEQVSRTATEATGTLE